MHQGTHNKQSLTGSEQETISLEEAVGSPRAPSGAVSLEKILAPARGRIFWEQEVSVERIGCVLEPRGRESGVLWAISSLLT